MSISEVGITATAGTLALGTLLRVIASQFQAVGPNGLFLGFRTRSLAMEFAGDSKEACCILGDENNWNRSVMRQIQIVDFALIAGYGVFFLTASVRMLRLGFTAGAISILFSVLGMYFDVTENLAILGLLRSRLDDSHAVQTLFYKCRFAAVIKWASILIAMLSLSWLLFRGYSIYREFTPLHLAFCLLPALAALTGLATLPAGEPFERIAPMIFLGGLKGLLFCAGLFFSPPRSLMIARFVSQPAGGRFEKVTPIIFLGIFALCAGVFFSPPG